MATQHNFRIKNGLEIAGTERISSAGAFSGSLASATTATTQSALDNSTKIATTAYTDAAITAVIGGAPGTLDTLNELAAAINDDASYASTLTTALSTKAPLASPDFTGQVQVTNSATTVQELIVTGNNTRSALSMQSKDSSGNAVDLRMHSLGDGPRGEIFTFTNHDLAFATNNAAPQMTLSTSGNVGIGETSPDGKLHITSNTPIIVFEESDASQAWRLGSFGGAFALYDSTDSAYRLAVDGSGAVGIGTTSPAERLTIGGGIGTNASTAFASMGGRLGFGNDYSDTQRGPNKIVLQNDGAWIGGLGISDNSVDLYSGGKFTFLDSSGANSYDKRMVIDNNGNVGINNSSPGTLLSLKENSNHTNNRISIFSSDFNYGQIRVGSSTAEASIGFLRSTNIANTENNSPSGGNDTWAIGLGVWGANFGIGSNSLLDNCVEWDSSGHMLPGSNNTYDLGSTAKGWRNVYTNDLHLSNMAPAGIDVDGNEYTREGNEVDGTNGSWTIQEGSDDLYLLNRLNGKKYKFKLEEVS